MTISLKTEPLYVPRVWGGSRFYQRHSDQLPLGEMWVASDQNIVIDGVYAGGTVADAISDLGEAFLGDCAVSRYGIELPLLAKLLDTNAWLSVQVHPDDQFAHTSEKATGFHGKTEAWLFLDVDRGAEVAYGLNQSLSLSELNQAVDQDALFGKMNHFSPRVGDVVFVPAGTIHALGPGLLLYEIQQRSELTYRLYDHGRSRPLHIEKGIQVADRHQIEQFTIPARIHNQKEYLFAGHDFALIRHKLDQQDTVRSPEQSFSILTRIDANMGETVILAAGSEIELPAGIWLQSYMADSAEIDAVGFSSGLK